MTRDPEDRKEPKGDADPGAEESDALAPEVVEAEVVDDDLVAGDDEGDDGATDEEGVASDKALVPARARALPAPSDPVARYLAEVRRIPSLEPDEEVELARRYRETGDREAAARLISANLLLVVKLAFLYRRLTTSLMDLIQEGNIGLMEALKRYDPDQGTRFPTYAAWWIKAYILKFLQDNRRMVRFGTTNDRRKLLYQLRREQAKLSAQGITPTPKLLAEKFDVAESDVIEAEKVLSAHDLSFDQPVTADTPTTVGEMMAGAGPTAEDEVIDEEIRERTQAAIAEFRETLNERERAILDLRLSADDSMTLQELGDRFGVTREAMRQSENKLKARLAAFLRDRLGDEVILHFTGGA